jgi:hypothetical protein
LLLLLDKGVGMISRAVILAATLAGGVVSFPLASFAECGGNRCTGKIDRIYPHTGGVVYISTDGDERNLACIASEGVYITLLPSQPLFTQIYDALLQALVNDKTAIVRIAVGSNPCRLSYVTIDR